MVSATDATLRTLILFLLFFFIFSLHVLKTSFNLTGFVNIY